MSSNLVSLRGVHKRYLLDGAALDASGDAGPADAGPVDAGAVDAGATDAGAPPVTCTEIGLMTRTIMDSASVGTPDTYFFDVNPGDPFCTKIVNKNNNT